MMTPRLFLLFCITLSFSTRIPLNAQSLQKGQTVDGYVAEVDGRIITLSDVIISTRQAMQELVQDHRGSRAELVRKQEALFKEGMEKLIDRKLMLAKFDKLEATLPPSAVRDQKERILRDRFQNNRAFLIQALRQTGMTELEWEQDMKENLIQQSMIQEFVQQRIQITPSEIRQAYEEKGQELQTDVEVHLRAIAFRPAKEGMEEERTLKIEAVQRMLQKGAKFSDVAIENSEGPKAHAGGDQGWKRQDTLPPQIRAVVEQAKVGEITDLVELPTQAYIFYIENRRGGERQSLAQAQAGIENELRSQKFEKLYNEWTQGLRKEFPVFRYDPDLSAVTGE